MKIQLKRLLYKNNISFCWMEKLSGKPPVTPLYLKSSMTHVSCIWLVFFSTNKSCACLRQGKPRTDITILFALSCYPYLSDLPIKLLTINCAFALFAREIKKETKQRKEIFKQMVTPSYTSCLNVCWLFGLFWKTTIWNKTAVVSF